MDEDREDFVAQFIKHYELHWWGRRFNKTMVVCEIRKALKNEGFSDLFTITQMRLWLEDNCRFWRNDLRPRPPHDDHFTAKEWERIDLWLRNHYADLTPRDTLASVVSRMGRNRLIATEAGVREGMLALGWDPFPAEPEPFIYQKGASHAVMD